MWPRFFVEGTGVKPHRAGQVRPLFLAACAVVLGLALIGVLIVAFQGDSTNGLIFGMALLFAASLGGMGLAFLILGRGRPERRLTGRPPSGALVFGFLGAAVGAMGSPAWLLPFLRKALPEAANNPLIWIASVGIGLGAGALVGVFIWRIRPLW
jgi:hypothetical protein